MNELHTFTITPDGSGPSSVASGWPPANVRVVTYDIAAHCCPTGAAAVVTAPVGDGYTCPSHGFKRLVK